jgi:hypothetical protein
MATVTFNPAETRMPELTWTGRQPLTARETSTGSIVTPTDTSVTAVHEGAAGSSSQKTMARTG